ncbi:S1 RNA-binding domain-containing protein [Pseudoteredinibacter isoporae]|uniref:Ribosomal protein S1 n=1 Tax=Pseudoteredinibacter isoporae TaxID=570281 RepID=A0A7X0JWB8_9GAMM|nr:S1 RNA-binding domain-containing protein [Pseudoteredinibacter isoporae]MBB6523019.1 ribosomal protein S1 [Pseudoteredinibacter isoporae]NHO88541.1 S1 RNA-binding domain-containing protein [Pseudoteredinibacter isoporae]NIB22768.1 S1 RNA-binding domain-containing protein [Pseudoteredinibacter isoporae]
MRVNDIIEVVVIQVEEGFVKVDYHGKLAILQITELTWRAGKIAPEDYVNVGDVVRVKIIKVDGDLFSVSLKEAQAGGNPWRGLSVGDQYLSPVVLKADYGYFFEITYFCHALLKIENASRDYQLGDRIRLEVSDINYERKRVYVCEK